MSALDDELRTALMDELRDTQLDGLRVFRQIFGDAADTYGEDSRLTLGQFVRLIDRAIAAGEATEAKPR